MTDTELNALHWEEYKEYIEQYKMSSYERKLLRNWVRSVHSVYETVYSRYLPGPYEPPLDYLEAYRFDKELKEEMKGMTVIERNAYLKALMGWSDSAHEQTASYVGSPPEQ